MNMFSAQRVYVFINVTKLTVYFQKGHLPSQKTEALRWSGPCFLCQDPTTASYIKERLNSEPQPQKGT